MPRDARGGPSAGVPSGVSPRDEGPSESEPSETAATSSTTRGRLLRFERELETTATGDVLRLGGDTNLESFRVSWALIASARMGYILGHKYLVYHFLFFFTLAAYLDNLHFGNTLLRAQSGNMFLRAQSWRHISACTSWRHISARTNWQHVSACTSWQHTCVGTSWCYIIQPRPISTL
jgi:hypothetical protein